jgi:hypothetical protein
MMQQLDRRTAIATGVALAATPAFAKDPKVSFAVPDGACDSHHHIYDPRFAFNPKAVLKPPYATVSDYRALQKKLGTSRNVMVQPSTYGTDNTCLMDVLAQMGENARAVCVVNSTVTDAELKKLHTAGTRAIRWAPMKSCRWPGASRRLAGISSATCRPNSWCRWNRCCWACRCR